MKKLNEVQTEVVAIEQKSHDVGALMMELGSKSKVIRFLSAEGKKTGEINKMFGEANIKMRYQHVRNVLITPIKKI
jgi:hypothetical protein